MMPERWKQVEAVFEQALELPAEQRPAFLQSNCDGDQELRREVQSLLDSHARAGSFIDQPSLFAANDESDERDAVVASGQLIGSYRVVRELGRGGMGAVYLAERADEQYRMRVAIKLIKRGMDTDSVLRHFRNERQILANFDHPNIAHLLDGGATENGLPYFVMEYIEGLPIDAYCKSQAVQINERLSLFRQVCAAVSYAHRRAVIHRDIKPSNILVSSDGTPKLLDFGIAKILQPADSIDALVSLTGLWPMTPEYASPEQVRGQSVTTASDVYSLGVVLYQLLTGQKPYRLKTPTPVEISRAIVEQEPLRPSTAIARSDGSSRSQTPNPKVLRGDLDNIVLMALRKEPGRRYQSVEQFSEDIQRYLERRPIRARKDTIRYRAARFVQRNRVATSAAALLFMSLLAGIVATTWEARRARKEEAIAKEQRVRAERRFNDVRHLAHSVLFDYHDAIKDLPGATRVRERLVKDALVYLDSLASEIEGDPALQRELAAAYDRVGDVRGQAYGASLGDRAGAMDSYLKGLRIREALATANPKDMQSRRELAESHRRIGWQLLDTIEGTRGLEHLRKAVDLDRELTAENPENTDLQYQLSVVQSEFGMALEEHGDLRGALDQLHRSQASEEKLLADHRRDRKYRRALSRTYDAMGRALGMAGDIAGALEANHKGLVIEEESVAEDPTNGTYSRGLEISYSNDGYYRDRLGDKRGAVESYLKGISISEQLVAADPSDTGASDDLAQEYQQVADSLAALGDNAQALLNYRKSLKLFDNVLVNAPVDLRRRLLLAISRAGVGKMQARLGERASAVEECRTTVSLLRETREDPANSNHRSLKAQAYRYLGEAYAALAAATEGSTAQVTQLWTAARDMFQQSFGICEDMHNRGILAPPDTPQIDEVAGEIAKCDAALRPQ
ncbi:MAG: protein kinase domain-containing protein [Chthoniobacterales bacterium]